MTLLLVQARDVRDFKAKSCHKPDRSLQPNRKPSTHRKSLKNLPFWDLLYLGSFIRPFMGSFMGSFMVPLRIRFEDSGFPLRKP